MDRKNKGARALATAAGLHLFASFRFLSAKVILVAAGGRAAFFSAYMVEDCFSTSGTLALRGDRSSVVRRLRAVPTRHFKGRADG